MQGKSAGAYKISPVLSLLSFEFLSCWAKFRAIADSPNLLNAARLTGTKDMHVVTITPLGYQAALQHGDDDIGPQNGLKFKFYIINC